MSAFIVSKHHIDTLLSAALSYQVPGIDRHTATDVGRTLWIENIRSVSDRYPARSDTVEIGMRRAEIYTHRFVTVPGIGETAKLIDCLEYQSCEHDGWSRSDACAWLGLLRTALLRALPDYEGSQWAIAAGG